jgi:putative N6-adenine-specific DNA methylase
LEIATPAPAFIAKTISGLEPVLEQELLSLGATGTQKLTRAVSFRGDKALLYKVNFCSATALRVLVPVTNFPVAAQQDLYDRIREIPWEDYLEPSGTLAVDAVISRSVFTNSQFVAQKTKDAVADRFRDRTGTRPSVDLENPSLRINIHLQGPECSVSVDSSGSSLHKRGYRMRGGEAPLSEVLAAGILKLAAWDTTTPLYDPMCGSGTLLTEAALMATATPPGKFRREFGFMKWKDFDRDVWKGVREEALTAIHPAVAPIRGGDISRASVSNAKENIHKAVLDQYVQVTQANLHTTKPPFDSGTIVTNPPYDERIRLDDSAAFYRSLGSTLKHLYSGYIAWILTGDLEAMKFIGLKPFRKFPLFNGPLEVRLLGFELFGGTLKEHKSGVENSAR